MKLLTCSDQTWMEWSLIRWSFLSQNYIWWPCQQTKMATISQHSSNIRLYCLKIFLETAWPGATKLWWNGFLVTPFRMGSDLNSKELFNSVSCTLNWLKPCEQYRLNWSSSLECLVRQKKNEYHIARIKRHCLYKRPLTLILFENLNLKRPLKIPLYGKCTRPDCNNVYCRTDRSRFINAILPFKYMIHMRDCVIGSKKSIR